MTRGIPSHPVLAAVLALALLVSISAPVGAAPYTTAGTGGSIVSTDTFSTLDGPGAHFGFSPASVLAQATATSTVVTGGQTNVNNNSTPASSTLNPANSTQKCAPAGGTCTETLTAPGSTGSITYTQLTSGTLNISLTVPTGAIAGTTPVVFVPVTNGTVERITTCPAIGAVGSTYTCTASTVGDLVQNGQIQVAFATATGVVTATGTATGPGAPLGCTTTAACITAAQTTPGFAQGQAGIACANIIGQSCTITGGDNGSATKISSFVFNVTSTSPTPAAVTAGTPFIVFSTTAGAEAFACGAVVAGTAVATCNGTTVGNILQGSSVAVFFPGVAAAVIGAVTGPGGIGGGAPIILPNLPLLPPPPLEFIPPPPPPLLPPPPPAAMGATAAPRMAGFPDVPVIPEADSLFLLVGGLVALGGLAAYRSLRRRDDA